MICPNARTHFQKQLLIHVASYQVGIIYMAITIQDWLRQMTAWHSKQQALKITKAIRRRKSHAISARKLVTKQTNVKKRMRL